MKKVLIAVLALVVAFAPAEARKVKGTVRGAGEPLSKVIVTDGVHFTTTDARGAYTLKVAKDARFVHIVTPSGFTAPYSSGTVEFYKPLTGKRKYDFDLQRTQQTADYNLFAIADPQMKPAHLAQFTAEPLEDLVAQAKKYAAQAPTVAIALGDIGWNILDVFGEYKASMAKTGIPCYGIIGNHDHNQERAGKAACEGYEAAFGPVNYAFFLGNDLVIGLDNLLFKGNDSGDPTKSGKYDEGYSEETLAFVKGLLTYVSKDTHLFIAQHSPLYRWFHPEEAKRYILRGEEMLDLLDGRKVDFISGHTHIQNNLVYNENAREHNAASLCGAWWSTRTCNDGTPRGYEIFSNRGDALTWFWHSVDHPDDYQVEFIDPGQSFRHPNSLVANVWDYDPSWTVTWTEDGVDKGQLYETLDVAPRYIREIQAACPDKISNYKRPRLNLHYFAATPSQYAKKVGIKVVSPAGKTWQYEFDMKNYIDVQSHRGGAGLKPENTWNSMLAGLKRGDNTLEMDFQISKDKQVVVSHENYFLYRYASHPDGAPVLKEEPRTYLYHLDYSEIAKWDVGLRGNEVWPDQAKEAAVKPLGSDLIDRIEKYTRDHDLSPVRYNIEMKTSPKKGESENWAEYHELVDLCLKMLEGKHLGDRLVIQCIDVRALEYMHAHYPSFKLAYLTAKDLTSVEEAMAKLSFTPEWWSPQYSNVTKENVRWCHDRGIKVVPWTADEPEALQNLIDCGVDAIITNRPDRLQKITRGYTTVSLAKEPI